MRRLLLSMGIAICLFAGNFSSAQTTALSGTITDAATGTPLQGVSVKRSNTRGGTTTDKNGYFSLQVNPTDVLEISYVGYALQLVHVEGKTQLNIQLVAAVTELNQVVLVGTRGSGRAKTETPVPVDIISVNQAALPTAKMDLTSVLNAAAPSFNYNKQSGSDGADQIDLATLRGLGPDQTLVLVNGKRRHQTAFVAVFGTRGRGNSGTDLNAIPEASIDRVEILRDGASAQYGSDAIAGVINIILKKDVNHLNVNAGYSGYYDHKYNTYFSRSMGQYRYSNSIDGNTFSLGINDGVAIGRHGGFINLSGNFLTQGKTFRQVNDTSYATGLPINTGRRAHGDGSVTSGGGMVNMEIPFGTSKTTFYAFGGYNYKSSDAFAYTRTLHGYNPSSSGHDDRFPTDANGNVIYVPGIMYSVKSPDGEPNDTIYDPHIQTHISDVSVAAGLKGTTAGNWTWDFSNTFGRNDFHFYGDKTFNASAGSGQTHFDDGGFSFLQNTTNITFDKQMDVAEGLNLALGAEYRYEQYKIKAGEQSSYTNYDPNFIKATGAQGFPGYRPTDVANANRSNIAGFADAELDITKKWLLGAAVRLENYNDFGFTSNYKLATRIKLAQQFNVRASVSTGFRAPSLQQINYSSQFTNVQGGNITEVKIAPNFDPVTRAAGISELKQEKSINASLGFSWKPVSDFTITVDGYYVKVKDRIVLSGQFSSGDSTLDPEFINALQTLHIDNAQFFANAVNTTNIGVDLVFDYNHKFSNRERLHVLLTGNIQHMKIDKINVPQKLNDSYLHRQEFFSDREQRYILASAPPVKLGGTIDYSINKFSVGTHLTYFGRIKLLGYGWTGDYAGQGINPIVPLDANPDVTVPELFNYNGKLVTDAYVSYKLAKGVTWFVGADNIFNVHPDLGYVKGAKYAAYDGETGGAWDAVQMGFNGIRLFTRFVINL
ncbi:TonB-dependent receptor [Deminuibacter soli]|uniref:TonB-dependent receptor n=1 Tax=Deminuibacter soli TaxID=2291815 RepID=A0A3E1NHM6_9BACT|nr:TonB-dependent receptor [Deminuibacter soli]RFM27382.1 TonB-dependent receptor [Deminuibacter soli]